MSLHLLTRYGLPRDITSAPAPTPGATSTDFSEYTLGVEPTDWTPQWVTSDVTYTVEETS